MSRDKNHHSHGSAPPRDADLLDMETMCPILPWLLPVLQELQYLRNLPGPGMCSECGGLIEALEEELATDAPSPSAESLRETLKKIGAVHHGD